ncbi:MAG TPA: hypothetical protein VHG08_07470 [Longimicrobium sp.]|nr:hypothetical protein [Longimicrobium sp.]
MSRIVFLLVLLLVAVLTVPSLRQRAQPHIEYVMNPIYRWDAKNRVNDLYRLLERERATGGAVPRPADFQRFLVQREGEKAALDPWRQPFFLVTTRRTFQVGSSGQDRQRGTADDILSKAEVVAAGR